MTGPSGILISRSPEYQPGKPKAGTILPVDYYTAIIVGSKNRTEALRAATPLGAVDKVYGESGKNKIEIWCPNAGLKTIGIDWTSLRAKRDGLGEDTSLDRFRAKTIKGTSFNLHKAGSPSDPFFRYNCHSYSLGTGGEPGAALPNIPRTSLLQGPFWIDPVDMSIILKDGYYSAGSDLSNAVKGDMLVWFSPTRYALHSCLVVEIKKTAEVKK